MGSSWRKGNAGAQATLPASWKKGPAEGRSFLFPTGLYRQEDFRPALGPGGRRRSDEGRLGTVATGRGWFHQVALRHGLLSRNDGMGLLPRVQRVSRQIPMAL